jgi:histidyl-tRNA synthetase
MIVHTHFVFPQIPTISDVLICTLGHRAMVKEQLHLASDLWAAGISAQVLYDTTNVSPNALKFWVQFHILSYIIDLSDKHNNLKKIYVQGIPLRGNEVSQRF